METLRTILQWATPSIPLLFLFRGAWKETKKAGKISIENGPASHISALIAVWAILFVISGYLVWVYFGWTV